jgi:hypothetical protein
MRRQGCTNGAEEDGRLIGTFGVEIAADLLCQTPMIVRSKII